MTRLLLLFGAALILAACSDAPALETPELNTPERDTSAPAAVEIATPVESDDAVVRFSEILDQYRALNVRLETVAARLQIANAELCPVTTRDPGYTVHTLADYPSQLQQVARTLLQVDKGLSVRTVRAGSSAEMAGVKAADRLIGINGQRFPGGLTQQKFYERASTEAYVGPSARLTVGRPNGTDMPDVMSFKIRPQTICGYLAHVVFDETINGHTDGRAVWITSELMRTVDDDVNLALIVAHEMAHAIDGDIDRKRSKALELKADSMALVMLERAGYETDRAVAYWSRADNPQRLSQSRSDTHPSITERLENFEETQRAIDRAKRSKAPLDFTLLSR